MGPDKWRFDLRQGVKFHNGEAWNAQAALPSLEVQGAAAGNSYSYPYTGPFTAEAVDEYTLEFTCGSPCPVLPNTTMFLNFTAPQFLATATEEERARRNMSFGPYKQVEWKSGISITGEVYDDYIPAGDHYEMQKGVIRDVTWLWRREPQVMVAMVRAGEADIAWDVGVDSLDVLSPGQVKSGGSGEVFALKINSLWGRETSKLKVRQAMAHAINCQEMIDALYGGNSVCRGNIIWPGVIGATEGNTAPWEYNPDLSRQLLEEADYDFHTTLTLVSRGTRIPKQVEVLEAVQSYLADIGMNLELRVVDAASRRAIRNCWAGQAVIDLLKERGRDVDPSEATLEEIRDAMAAATVKGSASCPASDLLEEEPSNETLDFGRQAVWYLNCTVAQSGICDPSPSGMQEKLPAALAASGEERRRLLADLADYIHDQVGFVGIFDLPVIYAVNPKLVWEPRFDRRIRVNAMSFSE
jgi:peptide/nickel transport system substrate-binding protein